MKKAFTLIELLVVVTIIVVLLALLVPAMDRAIYQAELAVCGTKLHAIGGGATVYAAGNKRSYPYQVFSSSGYNCRPIDLQYSNWGGAPPNGLDDRPVLRSFLKLNDHLNCPLAPAKVDLDGSKVTSNVITNYAIWFGFKYVNERGMIRIGDRLTFQGDDFALLATDFSGVFDDSNEWTGHNDLEGRMEAWTHQDYDYTTGNGLLNYTFSTWLTRSVGGRGPIDMNFGYADGSVAGLNAVEWDEGSDPNKMDRIVQVSQWNNPARQLTAKIQLPLR